MSDLGAVLEAVHGGRNRFSTVRATVREWRHFPRGRAAFSRVMERHGESAKEVELVTEAPEETEVHSRFWVAKPVRMRLERTLPSGEVAITVVDGDRFWSWHPEQGFASNQDGARLFEPTTALLEHLLDPWRLLGALDLESHGITEVARRKGYVLRAQAHVPRGRTALLGLGQGADAYELVVDTEHGILLRTEAQLAGEAFEVKELVDVGFDAEMPDDAFAFPS